MAYLRWAFPQLFCSVHYLLTFIFISVRRLLLSCSLFLYYDTPVTCIYRTLHNTTTKQQQKQRRGYVQSLLFCLLNYIIIFSNIDFISNYCLLWLYGHSFRFIFLRWVHSRIKFSSQTSDLGRHTLLAISPRFIQFISQFDQRTK